MLFYKLFLLNFLMTLIGIAIGGGTISREQKHADNTFDVGKPSAQQAARINEQLIVLHRQPIKIPEGIIGNVLNSLSQQYTNAQPATAQTGRDEAWINAGRDEAE
uniref:Uncharacterized protein n=1 Tax=Globodera rostochiensis TaxID=31243 RepID=A0A914HAV7_GLORO